MVPSVSLTCTSSGRLADFRPRSTERLLLVLVSRTGSAHRRIIEDPGAGDQAELDAIAAELNKRLIGHTLSEVREVLGWEPRVSLADGLKSTVDYFAERLGSDD